MGRIAWAGLTDDQRADRVAELAERVVRDEGRGLYARIVRDGCADMRAAVADAVAAARMFGVA